MSRKSFILTALVVNFTICVTLCIVLFTGNVGGREREVSGADEVSEIKAENTSDDMLLENRNNSNNIVNNADNKENEVNYSDERPSNQAIVNLENIEETTDFVAGNREDITTKIVESQIETDTQPYNYREQVSESQNTEQQQQTTTKAMEAQTIAVNGTTAIITGGCNIRSNKDVGNNIIGSARAGENYRIEPSQCTANWIAIYIDDSTLGYVSTAFCTIQ